MDAFREETMLSEAGVTKTRTAALVMTLMLAACGQGPAESGENSGPAATQQSITTEAATTTEVATTTEAVRPTPIAETAYTCGTTLPVFPITVGGTTAADFLGSVGTAIESLPLAPGQYAVHWWLDGVTTEIRWPAEPFPAAAEPFEPYDEVIQIGRPVDLSDGSALFAEVRMSDDPGDPCASLAVLVMGPITDQLQDWVRHFAEGLRPIATLDDVLVAADDKVALEDCPAAPPVPPGPNEVRVFVECTALMRYPSFPINRAIPDGSTELEAALRGLVRGTTPEEQQLLLSSGFDAVESDVASRIDVEARIDDKGVAHIDFILDGEPWGPGQLASTSHQVISFVDPLYATVFQFDEVAALDTTALCWGELACGGTITRSLWQMMNFTNRLARVDSECPLAAAWTDEECWLGSPAAEVNARGVVVKVAPNDTLNVRMGPGPEYAVVEEVESGASVGVTSIIAGATDGGSWRVIHTPTGDPGWVNDSFIEIVEE